MPHERRAEISDLARHAPAGAYYLLSCRVCGYVPRGRPGRGWVVRFAAGDNDAERDFRRRRTTEMMKT
jgi:hypothetical protein